MYGEPFVAGDVVTVELDCAGGTGGTLEYLTNSKSQGIAFDGVIQKAAGLSAAPSSGSPFLPSSPSSSSPAAAAAAAGGKAGHGAGGGGNGGGVAPAVCIYSEGDTITLLGEWRRD